MTREETPVSKAAQQELPAHPPELDRHPGLACLLQPLVLRKGHQPLPFGDKAVREFGDRIPCILDQPLIALQDRAPRQRRETVRVGRRCRRPLKPFDESLHRPVRLERTGFVRIGGTAEESSDLHLEHVAGALAHEAAEQEGVDVALHDRPAAQRHLRCGEGPLEESLRIAECLAVKRPVLAEGEGQSHRLAAPAGAADALPIVGDRRRHIGHHHR